ncbi:MAG TPA: recombination-associated protein RdgC, partial [Pseudoxanthomonas sp.]
MFFRNLTLFRFPTALASMLEPQEASEGGSFEMRPSVLDQGLAECALKPVGPLELYSRGFIPPMGQHSEALSHRIGNAIWITV